MNHANKLVLVTGAGGFIGSNLSKELVKRGYRVRVLLREKKDEEGPKDLIKNNQVEVVFGDLLDKKSLKLACKGVKIIFHLAAKCCDINIKEYCPYYETNVLGTKNLVESCPKDIQRFVFYSSIMVTKAPPNPVIIHEDYAGFPSGPYGRSKKEAEEYLLMKYNKEGFPVTILRPSTTYGPRDMVQYPLFKTIQKGIFFQIGSGNNLMSYVYVKNLIEATISAAFSKNTLGKFYYISDEHPYKFKEIVKECYNALGKNPPKFSVPFPIAYIGSAIFSFACRAFGIEPIIFPSRVNTMVSNYAYSIKKAKKDFGYAPRYGLKEAMQETCQWYRQQGMLE